MHFRLHQGHYDDYRLVPGWLLVGHLPQRRRLYGVVDGMARTNLICVSPCLPSKANPGALAARPSTRLPPPPPPAIASVHLSPRVAAASTRAQLPLQLPIASALH